MVQTTNNVLVALLLVVVIVLAAGMFSMLLGIPGVRLTGFNTGTGLTNVTVTSLASITLLRNMSYFGTGTPTGSGVLDLVTNGTNTNGFFNGSEGNGSGNDYGTGTHVYPFVVANDGNVDTMCVNMSSSAAAAAFIGGTSGYAFDYASINNETNSCLSGLVNTSWSAVSTSYKTVCSSLHTEVGGTGSNTVRIHWHLGIPFDASGAKTTTITVSGSSTC
jgi:hypothetical protein